MRYRVRLAAAIAAGMLVSACSQVREIHRQDDPGIYSAEGQQAVQGAAQSRREVVDSAAGVEREEDARAEAVAEAGVQESPVISRGPGVSRIKRIAVTTDQDFVPELSGEPISGSYNNIPLPAFIDVVFGQQLGLPYSLDPATQSQNDLVTLRLTEAVSPEELFRISRRTLMDYGVAMRLENGVYFFYIDRNIATSNVPILVTGRALPEVPESHRPVFIFVPLESVQPDKVFNWLRSAMGGQELEIKQDPARNSIILSGKPAVVEQALAMIEILDQPHMRGKYSISVEPAHARVEDLAKDLQEILQAEGYDATMRPPIGAILLLPLKSSNQLVVFAPSRENLEHVENWVKIIDRRQQLAVEDGIFSYEVRSTQAAYIVDLLNELQGERSRLSSTGPNAEAVASPASGTGEPRRRRGQFVVDSNRNAIIFRGSGKQWSELLPVIQDMDKLAPSVLVEVLLAEISLTDTDASSFQFLERTMVGDFDLTLSTLGQLGGGSSAFSATLDKAGDVRAILQLLYENRRAEIRSRPRLMVKSGQTATIDVGDEIPVRTQESQSVQNPDSPIVSNIVYRNTGVRLQIKPVVHNSGFVDIEVIQELSEAQVNESSGIDSPTIRNRSLQTTVTLRDGGSILLGGLIANSKTEDERGVPILGALPGVGGLFRSDGTVEDRRELLIMIIPYVMDRPEDAETLTEQLTDALVVTSGVQAAESQP